MINSIEYQANEHMKKAFELTEDLDNPFKVGTEEYYHFAKEHIELKDELNKVKDKLMIFIHLQTKKAIEQGCCEADAQHDFEQELI